MLEVYVDNESTESFMSLPVFVTAFTVQSCFLHLLAQDEVLHCPNTIDEIK